MKENNVIMLVACGEGMAKNMLKKAKGWKNVIGLWEMGSFVTWKVRKNVGEHKNICELYE